MSSREEMARAVLEQERDMIGAAQKAKAYDNSILFLKRNIAKGQISLKELNSVQQNQKAYRPLGRAFILRNKEDIQTELEGIIKNNETDIKDYEKNRAHLIKKRDELEKLVKEGVEKIKQMQQ
ncbi:hypothetical protein IMG5_187270 [Ichthyophthirius multifiliis]|uniref:Prefoldin subunit 1 n=1 Tax=Ichthyophthirius multifiliis TaxID=5932 RepID=G0R3R6_ICHMU|nr:hypothetical protein IMG5_187270 [Ichthyophthirius multifiliis]EGR27883.1 hypothetical protein IMG5_187270 [Ichthyophthirius multifiliis]|eukprot:XP_004027228.1 hypothetical protein IMG5_187270 [Ichthyophthirius multifiliis]